MFNRARACFCAIRIRLCIAVSARSDRVETSKVDYRGMCASSSSSLVIDRPGGQATGNRNQSEFTLFHLCC
uniref:Putative secreted protein n=1 Tax=Anopheles marajoara TaxID=58244 RepID=A0A2M4CE50_9DIPT